ncbi:MAG: hypothetical protein ACR2KV_17435 [Solirubrobacteraceae bacterium]
MNRESVRRPSPGTVVAIAALVLAATPIADAAAGRSAKTRTPAPVAHARFADNAANANRLNGYRASAVPTPRTLVPLGVDGRLPAAVLPRVLTGPQGARGPAGPAGPSGLDAPGVVTIVFQADGSSANPTPNSAAVANCPTGTKVLGGGFNDLTRTVPALAAQLPPGSVDEVQENEPFGRTDGTSGWRARIANVPSPVMVSGGAVVPNTLSPGTTYFQAYAICG